jgi:hypothetical protein
MEHSRGLIFEDEVGSITIGDDIVVVDDEVADEVTGKLYVVDAEEDSASALHVEEPGFNGIGDVDSIRGGVEVTVVAIGAIEDHCGVIAFGIELQFDVVELREGDLVAEGVGKADKADGAHRSATGGSECGGHVGFAHLFAAVVAGAQQGLDATDTQEEAQGPGTGT